MVSHATSTPGRDRRSLWKPFDAQLKQRGDDDGTGRSGEIHGSGTRFSEDSVMPASSRGMSTVRGPGRP